MNYLKYTFIADSFLPLLTGSTVDEVGVSGLDAESTARLIWFLGRNILLYSS
jgi:hypothetical protein